MGASARDTRIFDLAEDIEKGLKRRRGFPGDHADTGSRRAGFVSFTRQVIGIDQLLMRSPCYAMTSLMLRRLTAPPESRNEAR
jgi:hypothetical protein